MKIIPSDHSRMIDLPGVGPCPRPVDIDQSVTGFQRLKSLRIYRFQAGPPVHGDSEVDEVFILPLSGAFDMAISGTHPLAATVCAEGPTRALYMTPRHSYLLSPQGPVTVAYARAKARGLMPSRALTALDGAGVAEHLRYQLVTLAADQTLMPGWGGETLVHVAEGTLICSGQTIAAGQTVALTQAVTLQASGAARVLIIGV